MLQHVSESFTQLDQEIFLARKLSAYGEPIFTGITDLDMRREKMRAVIIKHKLATMPVGKNTLGVWFSYGELFEKIYGNYYADASI